jgi:hypothetical protein
MVAKNIPKFSNETFSNETISNETISNEAKISEKIRT